MPRYWNEHDHDLTGDDALTPATRVALIVAYCAALAAVAWAVTAWLT